MQTQLIIKSIRCSNVCVPNNSHFSRRSQLTIVNQRIRISNKFRNRLKLIRVSIEIAFREIHIREIKSLPLLHHFLNRNSGLRNRNAFNSFRRQSDHCIRRAQTLYSSGTRQRISSHRSNNTNPGATTTRTKFTNKISAGYQNPRQHPQQGKNKWSHSDS